MSDEPKPTVPDVLPLVWAYYAMPNHGAGGNLHIVLDDDNVDDDSVKHCLQRAQEQGDEAGVHLAGLLLRMSKTQRKKLASRAYQTPSATSPQSAVDPTP